MSVLQLAPSGLLVPGIHLATWTDLVSTFGQTEHRRWLLEGLKAGISILSAAGCNFIYVDGSFVTAAIWPNDYDACWALNGVDLDELRRVEPVFFDFTNGRAAQKARYRGEFFPAEVPEGISGRTFLDFFQTDRGSGGPKGIVGLSLPLVTP
jgi:hypothetical protein